MPNHPKRTVPPQKFYFRHLVDPDTPIGLIYNSIGKTKKQKELIGESLVSTLLPYAYKQENPAQAKVVARLCIQKLLAWIETLQVDFDLGDELANDTTKGLESSFLDRLVDEVQLLRQAFTEKSRIVDELRLIRETISAIQSNGGMILATPTDSSPLPLNTKFKETEIFVRGDNFLADLEEVL